MKFNFANTRLYVDDYDKSLIFYRDILGLKVVMESQVDRYVEFDTGTTKLTVMCRNQITGYFGSKTPVFFGHKDDAIALSFGVKDVDEACSYFERKGVEIVSQPWNFASWGVKLALIRDPEGNLVELVQLGEMVGAE